MKPFLRIQLKKKIRRTRHLSVAHISNFRTNCGLLIWYMFILSRYTRSLGVNFKSCLPFDGLGAKIAIFKSNFLKKKKISYVKNEILVFLFFLTQEKYVGIESDVFPGFKSQFYDQ